MSRRTRIRRKESRVIERRRGKKKSVCPLFLWQETSVLFKSHRCSIVHEIRKKFRALLIKSTENLHFLVSHRYLFLGPDASSSFCVFISIAFAFPSIFRGGRTPMGLLSSRFLLPPPHSCWRHPAAFSPFAVENMGKTYDFP